MSDDGLLGSLSVVGLLSLCCLGVGGIAGGAVLAGGDPEAVDPDEHQRHDPDEQPV